MITISVFWGIKNFTYKSYIQPMVGDLITKEQTIWGNQVKCHFIVTKRLLHISDHCSDLITIEIEPKN